MRAKIRKINGIFPVTVDSAVYIEGTNKTLADELAKINNKYVFNVIKFGTKGDGVTDDTVAIQKAVTEASNNKESAVLYFPKSKGYITTDTINIPDGIDVIMDSPILYNGVDEKIALSIGNPNKHNMDREFKIQCQSKIDYHWVNETNIGVKIINAYGCKINFIGRVSKFTQAIVLEAINGLGFTMNEIQLPTIFNSKIGLHITSVNKGWANANNYYGGFFGKASNDNPNKDHIAILINSPDKSYPGNNSNNFYGPRFEGGPFMKPIEVQGHGNTFFNIRAENCSTKFLMKCEGEGNDCINPKLTSSTNKIITTGKYFKNYSFKDEILILNENLTNDIISDEDGVVTLDKLRFLYFYDQTPKSTSPKGFIGSDINGIKLLKQGSIGVGTMLETDNVKEFKINVTLKGTVRLLVQCLDGEKQILTGENRVISEEDEFGFNMYIKKGETALYPHSGWNAYYESTTQPANTCQSKIKVSPEVKYIRLYLILQEAETIINNIKIYSIDTTGTKVIPMVIFE